MRCLLSQTKDDHHYYTHHEIGYNYRMAILQATLGIAKMEELPEFIRHKHRNYDLYRAIFHEGSAVAPELIKDIDD